MGELARKKIIKGLHYYKGKPFYISEGLVQTGVNIRIGSRPEITFHNIHPLSYSNRLKLITNTKSVRRDRSSLNRTKGG